MFQLVEAFNNSKQSNTSKSLSSPKNNEKNKKSIIYIYIYLFLKYWYWYINIYFFKNNNNINNINLYRRYWIKKEVVRVQRKKENHERK